MIFILTIQGSIKPVGDFQDHGAILYIPAFGEIVIGIDQEQIGDRFVPPLKPCIDIQIVRLFIILHIGGKK